MNNKICSIFGHRNIKVTKELETNLFDLFTNLINLGYTYFYFGGFGMFDELCHNIITNLKKSYKHIKRIFCLSDQKYLNINKIINTTTTHSHVNLIIPISPS